MNKRTHARCLNLIVVAGIRAQFMKLAAFQRTFNRWRLESPVPILATYINTGQHYDDDLAGSFINELGVQFDVDFTGSYDDTRPIKLFAEMITKLYDAFSRVERPIDSVIVFGDANSTAAAAIAAAKKGLTVVHIEAGVRTGDRNSPEEVNRIIADHLSNIHFLSSKQDMTNLHNEGLSARAVWTGDLIGDLVVQLSPDLPPNGLGFRPGDYVLASLHREENLSQAWLMNVAINALEGYSKPIIFIAHPRTRATLRRLGLCDVQNIRFIDAFSYAETLSAIRDSYFVFTDSGAFQREAYYLKKRCLVLQKRPFWYSLIEAGVHRAVNGQDQDIKEAFKWIEQELATGSYPNVDDLGDGNAGRRILESLVNFLSIDEAENSTSDKPC